MMGIWATLMMIVNYSSYSHLGVLQSAEKEIPYQYGKKDFVEAEEIKNVTFGVNTIMAVLISVSIAIGSLFLRSIITAPVFIGLNAIAVIILLQQFYSFYTVLLRTSKRFKVISKVTVLSAVVNTLLIILLVIRFGIYGIYLSTILNLLAAIIYVYFKTRFSFRIKVNFIELWQLLKIGFPLLIYGVIFTTLRSIDKIVIIRFLGATSLGYYSIPMMAATYLFNIPNVFSVVMFPRFQETYGANGKVDSIKNYVMTSTLIISHLMPFAIGAAYIIIPYLVQYVLPAYLSGLAALKILLAGTFFISLVHMSSQFLITINKQVRVVLIAGFAVAIGFLLNYSFVTIGYGIEGAAAGTSIAYALYLLIILGYAMSHFSSRAEILLFFWKICWPLFYSFAILLSMDFIKLPVFGLIGDGFVAITKLLLFSILCFPLLWSINRQTGILRRLASLAVYFFRKALKIIGYKNA
jgi:O-antigen/teichoic acid export membrane protein